MDNLRNKCDLCDTAIYEVFTRPQYKICALCDVYNKCKCCIVKPVAILDASYPYCHGCYLCVTRLSIIVPNHIYISDYFTAQNYALLEMYGIRQILTIGKELPTHTTDKFKTMHISLDDHPNENITAYFQDAHAFIRQAPTLIHCYAGISRSASLVIAYLISHLNMSLDDAITYCKKRRPRINPNHGFIQQLKEYEASLKKNINSSKALILG